MQRAQVQLTEEQLEAIRAQAARDDTSVSEVVRRAIDAWVRHQPEPSPREMRQRALAAAGQFGSGSSDGSVRHDDFLAEAFGR
jgi:Arc/MetJ-type ribon-helix-helix transcriptional regulator